MILKGRGVFKGVAEGVCIKDDSPVSFLGGVDATTGVVADPSSAISGESIAGKIFAFPNGKGSTVGSYSIYQLKCAGAAPSAIINTKAEAIVAAGAVISDIPMIDGVEMDILRTGDILVVDGEKGQVEIKGIKKIPVVTSILRHEGKVLVLKRSESAPSFKGKWSGLSGIIEEGEAPMEAAIREIGEEAGLAPDRIRFVKDARPLYVRRENIIWEVCPMLFEAFDEHVSLNSENTDHKWVLPEQVQELNAVDKLPELIRAIV